MSAQPDKQPLVSVVVTTYNHAAYIEQALDSVLSQSMTDLEVIVVDDGSTDDTPSRLEPYANHPAVTLVRQANAGIAQSRNTGVRHARGTWVAFLDGDDLWHPDKLAVQVAAMQQHPTCGLVAVNGRQFDPSGQILMTSLLLFDPHVPAAQAGVCVFDAYRALLDRNIIMTVSQVMVPRSVLQEIGPSDPDIVRASDYDLYLRISERYAFCLVDQPLMSWRYLSSSASGPLEERTRRYVDDYARTLHKAVIRAPQSCIPVIRSRLREKRASQAWHAYLDRAEAGRLATTRRLAGLLREGAPWARTLYYTARTWAPLPARRSSTSVRGPWKLRATRNAE